MFAEVSRKSNYTIENGIYIPSTVLALKIAKTIKCKVEVSDSVKYLVSNWDEIT